MSVNLAKAKVFLFTLTSQTTRNTQIYKTANYHEAGNLTTSITQTAASDKHLQIQTDWKDSNTGHLTRHTPV